VDERGYRAREEEGVIMKFVRRFYTKPFTIKEVYIARESEFTNHPAEFNYQDRLVRAYKIMNLIRKNARQALENNDLGRSSFELLLESIEDIESFFLDDKVTTESIIKDISEQNIRGW